MEDQQQWKLVPMEPTEEMLEAGAMRVAMNAQYVATAEAKAEAVWRDMLAASPSSSVLERARDALKDMTQWVAAFAMGAGSHGVVMASPRMEKARSALAEIDRALGGGNAE